MAEEIKLQAEKRETQGKGDARRLRRTGKIPAVVYSEGKEAVSIQIDSHEFELMLNRHAAESILVELVVDGGKATTVLLKDVQHEPLKGLALHADFYEIDVNKILTISVGVNLTGEAVGVLQSGGVLSQVLRDVEIECLPTDIIEQIDADISGLELNDALRVGDLEIPDGVTVLTPEDVVIANVTEPRIVEDDTEGEGEEGAEGAEGAEGEGAEGGDAEGESAEGGSEE